MIGEPPQFGPEFLAWFRAATERAWASHSACSLADYRARRVGGKDWRQGTRWAGGLTASQVDALEAKWRVQFPADFRLFLTTLHCTTPVRTGAHYEGEELVADTGPGFYNWSNDAEIAKALTWPVEGLLFDVEHNSTWLDTWGPRPTTAAAREAVVRKVCADAPGFIPIHAHRYMLSNEARVGSAVLSVWQTDIIVYGVDLRDYLLNEFADLLGLQKKLTYDPANYKHIPVWGPFIG